MNCRATYIAMDFLITSATNTFSITTLLHGLRAYILVCHLVIFFVLYFQLCFLFLFLSLLYSFFSSKFFPLFSVIRRIVPLLQIASQSVLEFCLCSSA